MKALRSSAVVTALTLAVTAFGAGVAAAEPNPSEAESVIHYTTNIVNTNQVVTTVDSGSFRLSESGGEVELVDNAGALMQVVPLRYGWDGVTYPVAATISQDGRQFVAEPKDFPTTVNEVINRDRGAAWEKLKTEAMNWWNTGGMMTVAIGATIGQVVGCIAILLNPIAGCILGTIVGAGIGAVVGIVQTGQTLQPAMFEYFATFDPNKPDAPLAPVAPTP